MALQLSWRSPFTVRGSPGVKVRGILTSGAVKTSVTLLVQDIGNTIRILVFAIWIAFLLVNSWLKVLRFLRLTGIAFGPLPIQNEQQTGVQFGVS
jgi:hypothetical protein